MEPKNRLGRGLTALLGDMPGEEGVETNAPVVTNRLDVKLEQVVQNPYQPRKTFDDDELMALCESIKQHGVLQPIVVREKDGRYQIIAGERRFRASQLIGLAEVPVTVVAFDDRQVLEAALVENIQRTDLNAIEKAESFKQYLDQYGVTQEELAGRLGMDRSSVSNLVNLLNLPKEVQTAVRMNQISLGHAKILKGVADANQQTALCKEVTLKGLSVKALETIVKQLKEESSPQPEVEASGRETRQDGGSKVTKTPHVVGLEDEFRQRLATKFEIKLKSQEKGQFVIHFENNDEFERVVELLRRS